MRPPGRTIKVAPIQIVRRDLLFHAGAANEGGLRDQREQCPKTSLCPADRELLEAFADREQERKHRCFLDLAERQRTPAGKRHQRPDPDLGAP